MNKKTKTNLKRTLSVFLTLLMLLSAFSVGMSVLAFTASEYPENTWNTAYNASATESVISDGYGNTYSVPIWDGTGTNTFEWYRFDNPSYSSNENNKIIYTYPSDIYVDLNEDLSQTGYKAHFQAAYGDTNDYRFRLSGILWGEVNAAGHFYDSEAVAKVTSSYFNNYGHLASISGSRRSTGDDNYFNNNTTLEVAKDSASKNPAVWYSQLDQKEDFDEFIFLTGKPKATTGDAGAVYQTYGWGGDNDTAIIAYDYYRDLYVGGSWSTDRYLYKSSDSQGGTGFYTTSSVEIGGYKEIKITYHIYDKSTLSLLVNAADEGLIAVDAAALASAKTVLKTRETTQTAIDAAVNSLGGELASLIAINAQRYANEFGSANLTNSFTAPTYSFVPTVINGNKVSEGFYSNVVYEDTMKYYDKKDITGMDIYYILPVNLVAVYDDSANDKRPIIPVEMEHIVNNSSANVIHAITSDTSLYGFYKNWDGYVTGTKNTQRETWASTSAVEKDCVFSYQVNGDVGVEPSEASERNNYGSQIQATNKNTPRMWWNTLRYTGEGNTSNYYDLINSITLRLYASRKSGTPSKRGYANTPTELSVSHYIINYKPVKDALGYAKTAYDEMTANAWKYTETSINRVKATIYQMLKSNPNDFTYAGNVSDGVTSCATAIKKSVQLLGAATGGTYGYEGLTLVPKTGTVTFNNYDGTEYEVFTKNYGETFTVPAVPTKSNTKQYTYSDYKWSPEVTVGDSLTMSDTYAGQTYNPTCTETTNTYTVTFLDGDESTVLQRSSIAYGTTPTYSGKTPSKEQTASKVYTYSGNWKNTGTNVEYAAASLPAVKGDVTYQAMFDEETREYTITWVLHDGNQTTSVAYNSMPSYDVLSYVDGGHTYKFKNWNTPPVAVTSEATYTAVYELDTTAANTHTYGTPTWSWAEDASSATATFTCTVEGCGNSQTETATVTDAVTTDPSCTVAGVRTYTATVTFGGETYTDTKTAAEPATGHTYGTPTWSWAEDYSSATATFTCEKNDDTQTVTDENPSSAVTTDPTHIAAGVRTYTATVTFNGNTYTDTATAAEPKTAHTFGGTPTWSWTGNDETGYTAATATFKCTANDGGELALEATVTPVTQNPTHTENGKTTYTATVTLNGTDYTDSKEVTIYAAGHTYGDPTWTWNSGHTSATATFTCIVEGCGDQQEVTATGTAITSETTAATHAAAGKTTYTATVTFNSTEYTDTQEVAIPQIAHTYGAPSWSWTGNDETGYTAATVTFTCTGCDDEQEMTATVTPETDNATHFASGKTTYTAKATFNGTEYTDSKEVTIPQIPHTYGEPEWTWTGSDAAGYTDATATFTCSCGDTKTETDTSLGVETTAATCLADGKTTYTAEVTFDGATYTKTKDVTITAPGHHDFDYTDVNYTETKEDDAIVKVIASTKCKNCDAEYTETATAANGKLTSAQTKAPTCAAKGETTYTATFEKFADKPYTLENVAIDPTAHNWVAGTLVRPTKNADSTWNDGYTPYTCANDSSHTKQEPVARADYSSYDTALQALKDLLDEDLTDDIKAKITEAITNSTIDLDKTTDEQDDVNAAATALQNALDAINTEITSKGDDAYQSYTLTVSDNVNATATQFTGIAGKSITITLPDGYKLKTSTATAGSIDGLNYTFTTGDATATVVYLVDTAAAEEAAQNIINSGNYDEDYATALQEKLDAIDAIKEDPDKNENVKTLLDELKTLIDAASDHITGTAQYEIKFIFGQTGSNVIIKSLSTNAAVTAPDAADTSYVANSFTYNVGYWKDSNGVKYTDTFPAANANMTYTAVYTIYDLSDALTAIRKAEGTANTTTQEGYDDIYDVIAEIDALFAENGVSVTNHVIVNTNPIDKETAQGQAFIDDLAALLQKLADTAESVEVKCPSGHDYVSHELKQPTCTENGHTAYKECRNCGTKIGYEVIPMTGHSDVYTLDAIRSGKLADGTATWETYTCQNGCGDYYLYLTYICVDTAGNAVEGATVTLDVNGTTLSGTSDANGVVAFSDTALLEGEYAITVAKDDTTLSGTIRVHNGRANAAISRFAGESGSSGSSSGFRCPMCNAYDELHDMFFIGWFIAIVHYFIHMAYRIIDSIGSHKPFKM